MSYDATLRTLWFQNPGALSPLVALHYVTRYRGFFLELVLPSQVKHRGSRDVFDYDCGDSKAHVRAVWRSSVALMGGPPPHVGLACRTPLLHAPLFLTLGFLTPFLLSHSTLTFPSPFVSCPLSYPPPSISASASSFQFSFGSFPHFHLPRVKHSSCHLAS